jgi:hypothetical protein
VIAALGWVLAYAAVGAAVLGWVALLMRLAPWVDDRLILLRRRWLARRARRV